MTEEVFQFELNESLFFENGQEVKEMLKVSLDPEITIQPFHEYVSIRGVVELQGEYEKQENDNEPELRELNVEEQYSRCYLERIEDIDEGRASFSHRFPVEISIPAYRVTDINDITVSIDTFDYEIPSNNQLNLAATIAIEGVSDVDVDSDESDREESSELEGDHFALDLNVAKHKEEQDQAQDQAQEQLQEASEQEQEQEEIDEPDTPQIEIKENGEESKEEQNEEVSDRWFKKKAESLESFFNKHKNKQTTEPESIQNNEEEIINQTSESAEEESLEGEEDEEITKVETRIDEAESESESEDVTYLTDIFRDRENEQTHVKLRICIVQDKDTITEIAERYEVSESLIRKQNELIDDELTAGQLLSIPSK